MGDNHRILIVDDDVISVAVLEETLSAYETATASSGEEVLPLVSLFKPDMIMLDVNLPGISGYDVCRALRREENIPTTRIILVSANLSLEERLRGYEAGADDYIVKPFSPDELKAKVDVFLKLKNEAEVDETKSNLLGVFSHETRTPLGVVIGLSDLLRIDEAKDAETRKCAQAIYENAVGLHRFIEKATLLSKIKSGYTPMRTPGSLAIHIDKVVRRVEPDAMDKRVAVTVKIQNDILISLDWEIFDEALSYILENSVKFSWVDGEVQIAVLTVDSTLEIAVSDSGRGITMSWIANIFDEFSVRDINHHHRGHGLSLSVVKRIVELHDGAIEVKSRPGAGTTFTIRLPL